MKIELTEKYLEKVYESYSRGAINGSMMPFSTGEYFVYHFRYEKQNYNSYFGPSFEITLPRRFKIGLYYKEDCVKYKKYDARPFFYYSKYYEIKSKINLRDYFECVEYKDILLPVNLNKPGIEKKIKQAEKLAMFL